MAANLIQTEIETTITTLETSVNISPHTAEHQRLFQQILQHTRTSSDDCIRPLFTRRGVQVLSSCAFGNPSDCDQLIALRCLNNILARAVTTRQLFVEEGCPEKVLELMKIGNPDYEVATANLMLLSSVNTSLDLTESFESHGLAEAINKNISRSTTTPSDSAPAIASLKLLSTLAVQYEKQAYRFLPSLHPILEMLSVVSIPSPPLQPPVSLLVACLASLPFQETRSFPIPTANKLAAILLPAIAAPSQTPNERELMPLVMVFLRIAQSGDSATRQRLSEHLLPSSRDRDKPLGQGDSLPHRMLKLSTSSLHAELRELILTVYHELAGRDATQFVRHVGYGNAAGFLRAKGIPFTQEDPEEAHIDHSDFDPVTGQRWSSAPQPILAEMTAEDKEREAERLFVLFQRLKSTGVVDVENPMARMQQTGQLEELPDDSSE